MTGLCCRCQVRHGDELCCRHGVICTGDLAGPPEHGYADVLLVCVAAVALGAVVAVCARLGQTGSDGTKLAVGVVLAAAALATLWWTTRADVDARDEPPPWVGPGTYRNTEPEEQSWP